MLTNHHYDVKGSKVILITDGADSNHILRDRVMREYIANKITVDSIAITNAAFDYIVDLAEHTGKVLRGVVI